MKQNVNDLFIVYLVILLAFITNIFIVPNYFASYSDIVSLVMWILIVCTSFFLSDRYVHLYERKEKAKTILIILFTYYILYLLLGLLLGYQKSPYAFSFNEISKNLFLLLGVGLIQEFVRTKLLKHTTSYVFYFAISILFVVVNLDFTNLSSSFANGESIFKYIVQSIFVPLLESGLLTYLSLIGGIFLNYSYKIPTLLAMFLLPIFPSLDWFVDSSFRILLVITIFLFTYYENQKQDRRLPKKNYDKPLQMVPLILLLIVFVAFMGGFFAYRPIAVLSDSMKPVFSKGDLVISKKIKGDYDSLQIGDIIEYSLNGKIIMHRLVDEEKDIFGHTLYVTKGDNNSLPDKERVLETQITGTIQYTIPYLGYPSVLLKELIDPFGK